MSSPQRPAPSHTDDGPADEPAERLSPDSSDDSTPEPVPGGDAQAAERTGPPAPQGPVARDTVLGGRYRVAERVGAGGMATIYRGFDLTLERPVAIKVLHAHLADDAELQSRFRTEARHAASLSHPHIVTVYDQGVAALPYIVMELIDGPSLREVLTEHGRLKDAKALAIIEPVARALARAHLAGVVHRDIKPENVLVAADGAPKVADFGIARVVAGTSHTQTGALIGSVHYMAPELVDGHEATQASDQYAVGVMLYELLTGQRPFAGDSPMAVAMRHARDRVPAPSTQGADCGADVDAVVARATAHDPADRYPGLDAFAVALRAAVPGGPAEVEIARDGEHTLVIPAEARETTPIALQHELASRRAAAPSSPAAHGLAARSAPADSDGTSRPHMPLARTPRGRGQPTPDRQEEPPRGRGRRARRVLVAGLLTVALLLGAAGGAYAWWHYLVAPVTAAPALVGLSEEAAFQTTTDLGLGLAVDDLHYDFDAPEGQVLSQDPAADTELRRGDDMSVVLSRGPEPVRMPEVVGRTGSAAIAALEGERLEVSLDHAHHDDVREGVVISQDPAADRSLHQGDQVTIVVSLGIEQVEVPLLAGRDQGEVEGLLSDARLEPGEVTRVWSDDVTTQGEVISQSLDAGDRVDKGSVVDVTVSLGPRTIAVPDLRGEPVGDARATLEARSLAVEVIEEPRFRFGPFVRGNVGYVEEQLPAAGESIQRGETVTIYTFSD